MARDTRFDTAFIERHLAAGFFEFGRSGKACARAQTLAMPQAAIEAVLPLSDFPIRMLGPDSAQFTCFSAVRGSSGIGHGRRSSL